MITKGMGKHQVWLQKHCLGDDKLYIVGGGQQPHIGCIVLCEPSKPTQIINRGNHKEQIVLQPLAEHACKKYNTTVTVLGGIHIDNATIKDIALIKKHCKELLECI